MKQWIVHNGQRHDGQTWDSIARRVWGRDAEVRLSADPSNRVPGAAQAMVTRTDRHGTHVLASVVLHSEEEQ